MSHYPFTAPVDTKEYNRCFEVFLESNFNNHPDAIQLANELYKYIVDREKDTRNMIKTIKLVRAMGGIKAGSEQLEIWTKIAASSTYAGYQKFYIVPRDKDMPRHILHRLKNKGLIIYNRKYVMLNPYLCVFSKANYELFKAYNNTYEDSLKYSKKK